MSIGELINNAQHGHRYKGLSREDTVDIARSYNTLVKVIEKLRDEIKSNQKQPKKETP